MVRREAKISRCRAWGKHSGKVSVRLE